MLLIGGGRLKNQVIWRPERRELTGEGRLRGRTMNLGGSGGEKKKWGDLDPASRMRRVEEKSKSGWGDLSSPCGL